MLNCIIFVFLIVANHLQPSGLETNSEAGDDHEDAGQEEDEDEQDRAALHSDPVLDQEGEDVPGGGEDHLLGLRLPPLLPSQVKVKLMWMT